MAAAGCTMVHGTKGGHSQTLATSELSNAEIIVIAPCGFSIERTASELAGLDLLQSAEWQGLDAVKRGRVYVADGNLYFNRSSCGVVETAEMVAEMARPDLKGLWGHHGKHWVALDELEAFCGREGAPPPTKPVAVAEEASDANQPWPAASSNCVAGLGAAPGTPQATVALTLCAVGDRRPPRSSTGATSRRRRGGVGGSRRWRARG